MTKSKRVKVAVSAVQLLAYKTRRKMEGAGLEGAAGQWCCAGYHCLVLRYMGRFDTALTVSAYFGES